ncbi:MAG: hypothetical protein JAZ03_18840 [Candidatus Thiodiazotropha taylori]|nr:hypothetical protein [Candidatus Thiodiazotropha taylori]MCW4335986.1 hypothetical protein [Candidatus Thiodiazotropha endolucinida]
MAETSMTLLKPVILANDDEYGGDDYHEQYVNENEQTAVKQVYSLAKDAFEDIEVHQSMLQGSLTETQDSHIQCAQRPLTAEFNVSTRQLVHVSPDNVESVYKDILESSTSTTDLMVDIYRDLPKELFLSRILNEYHSDENELYNLRNRLFCELKCQDDFPFAPGSELKRRKQTRVGEGVPMKLCSDIYILTAVVDGAPFDDMKDLISSSKLSSQSISVDSPGKDQSRIEVKQNKTNCCDTELALLKNIISSVQADILQLKELNRSLKEEYTNELKLVKEEIKSIQSNLKSASESRSKNSNALSEMRQAIDRLVNDKSNGVANIKGDIKQMRSELKMFDDANEIQIASLKERVSDMQKLDKRVKNLEGKVNHKKAK